MRRSSRQIGSNPGSQLEPELKHAGEPAAEQYILRDLPFVLRKRYDGAQSFAAGRAHNQGSENEKPPPDALRNRTQETAHYPKSDGARDATDDTARHVR